MGQSHIFNGEVVDGLIGRWLKAKRQETKDRIFVEIWEATLGLRRELLDKIGYVPGCDKEDLGSVMLCKLIWLLNKIADSGTKISDYNPRFTDRELIMAKLYSHGRIHTILFLSFRRALLSEITKCKRLDRGLVFVDSDEALEFFESQPH